MTIAELEALMTKIHSGYTGMSDVEFTYASRLYEATRDYRDAIVRAQRAGVENRKYKEFMEKCDGN